MIVWTSRGANGTRMLQARSENGGRTFEASTLVPGGDAVGNRGWESIADRDGVALAVWLDHRGLADDAEMTMHHHDTGSRPDGLAMARKSSLDFTALDGSIAPRAIDTGVCYCCKTSVVVGRAGAIHAAWRQVYPGNIHDIAFTSSRDGRTFAARQPLPTEGTPHHPQIVAPVRRGLVVAWTANAGAEGSTIRVAPR